MQFGIIEGLYLLSFLIPLILLYMIKAKPREVTIPSLLFFSEDKSVKKYNSLFRRLLIRALFFLQLVFIVLIAFSAANPLVIIPVDAYASNEVVIVDVSASMATMENGVKRMDTQRQQLLNAVKGSVSIILAEENPVVIATNVSASRARALLTNLEPKDVNTRLDSAVLLANEMLGSERGTIIIYSDFILDKEDDILAAKKVAEASDKRVMFIQVGKKQNNIAFVNLNLNKGAGEAFVKNFGEQYRMIDVNLIVNGKQKEAKRIDMTPYSTERVAFDILQGETVLELSVKDSLTVDDRAYIINPYGTKIDVLFITSKKDRNILLDAVQANPQLNVEVAIPPVIPDL